MSSFLDISKDITYVLNIFPSFVFKTSKTAIFQNTCNCKFDSYIYLSHILKLYDVR